MGSTSGQLAASVLDAIDSLQTPWAVLHEESRIAAGEMQNDLDLVVDVDPRCFLATSLPVLTSLGLHPVVVNEYDIGGTLGVWLATTDAAEGVQIDIMHDPEGIGKFGISGRRLLERAKIGVRWPTVSDDDELVYLLRKRHYKSHFGAKYGGDEAGLAAVVAAARDRGYAVDEAMTHTLTTSAHRVARDLVERYPAEVAYRHTPAYRAKSLSRYLRRLVRPTGFWVELLGSDAAATAGRLAVRFARFLPVARAVARPAGVLEQTQFISSVAAMRWRPHLVVSSALAPRIPRADLRLDAATHDVDGVAVATVAAMRERLGLRAP